MYLTYGLFAAGALCLVVGLWKENFDFVVAGLIAIAVAAILRRAKGRLWGRVSKKGVEVEATLIPPPDDPDATP
jgi:hypothetical protein